MADAVDNSCTEGNASPISRGLSSAENDMPQALTETLQHIQAALVAQNVTLSAINATLEAMNLPAQPVQEKKAESSHTSELSMVLDPRAVREFRYYITDGDCDKLMEMVDDNKHPAQLMLQVHDDYGTALHAAVKRNSAELVAKLAAKCKDMIKHGSSEMAAAARAFPLITSKEYGLNAFDMVVITGNQTLLKNFEDFFEDDWAVGYGPMEQQPHEIPPEAYEHLKALLNEPVKCENDYTGYGSWGEFLRFFCPCGAWELQIDPQMCLHLVTLGWWTSDFPHVDFPLHDKDHEVPLGCAFLERVRDRIGDLSILTPLFLVRDYEGKTPLHACMHKVLCLPTRRHKECVFRFYFKELLENFPDLDPNVTDFMGRTPLHWAAAQGFADAVAVLVEYEKTDLNAVFDSCHVEHRTPLSAMHFEDMTALHLAVINNHVEVVQVLLNDALRSRIRVNSTCYVGERGCIIPPMEIPSGGRWTCLQLASHMGHVQILQLLLKDVQMYEPGLHKRELGNRKSQAPEDHDCVPALHIAAAYSQPFAIKALANCELIDVSARDKKGNTALHYCASMAGRNLKMLTNYYVCWDHFYDNPCQSVRICGEDDIITCMDILMQSGLNMQQKNKENETPMLPSSTHIGVKQAWLKNISIEAQENKKNLSTAANAISVTAALVATTSFQGPLQPPIGLSSEENPTWLTGDSRINHVAANVFFICDCFSFYFAIASIIFALLPSLAIPYEGIWKEVQVAKRCVQIAVLLLFGSIIFVICAFSAASIANIPEKKWLYKAIAIACISLGGLLCSSILILSFFRLLTLFAANNETIQRMSNAANSTLLWRASTQ